MTHVWAKRPATTKVELTSKRIGRDEHRVHRPGSKCLVERSHECMGQFIVWFPGVRFVKVDAINLPDTITYTDQDHGY